MNNLRLLVIIAIPLACVEAEENWLDLEHSTIGNLSESDWPGVCNTGHKQSPIELNEAYATNGPTKLHILNDTVEQPHLALLYNGYVVILHNFTQFRELVYVAEQIHFHCGAEHVLENARHDMEVQIVFRLESAASLKEAFNQTKGLVIVSVVFAVSYVRSRAMAAIVDTLRGQPLVNESTWKINEINSIFLMRELYGDIGAYYQYRGSLTVPGCGENVEWIVKAKVQTLTRDQMELSGAAGCQYAAGFLLCRK
ncbi:carbonic anhydrase 6-like [Drosophila subobscura]|uniref:carbonic anhydrase 6-like n=1 Tax=Drosophila subobscura TaxID=7241 RepID=UPI00155AAFD8|nr:carbonic anhydrase 6-like [Drosophila subobscura]